MAASLRRNPFICIAYGSNDCRLLQQFNEHKLLLIVDGKGDCWRIEMALPCLCWPWAVGHAQSPCPCMRNKDLRLKGVTQQCSIKAKMLAPPSFKK
jgi:hypothetical protein